MIKETYIEEDSVFNEQEIVSRGDKYPSFDVISEQPIVANDYNQVTKIKKTQSGISANSKRHVENLFDNVGASYYILHKLYKENSWIYLASNTIASASASCNPLFKIKSQSDKKNIVGDLSDLLQFPNFNETGYNLFYKTYLALAKYGNAFWQVIKKKNGQLHSIHFIPTHQMRAIPFINEQTNNLEFYYCQMHEYTQNVQRVFFEEDIIHFKLPNDDSIVNGLSPQVPLFKDVTFDLEAKKWINSWFQKTFTGGMILEMKNSTKEVVKRNRQEIREKFEGSENAGRTLILEGDMSLVYDGNKVRDFNLSTMKQISRDDILTAYGVPLSIAGVRSDIGQGNAEVISSEEQAFARNTLSKYQSVVFNTLNLKLFRRIMKNNDLSITHGANTTFSLKNASDIVKTASQYCGTTLNENRETLGLPTVETSFGDTKVEQFNKPLVATNNSIVPLPDLFDSFANQQLNPKTPIDKTVSINADKPNIELK